MKERSNSFADRGGSGGVPSITARSQKNAVRTGMVDGTFLDVSNYRGADQRGSLAVGKEVLAGSDPRKGGSKRSWRVMVLLTNRSPCCGGGTLFRTGGKNTG